jgi:hypothetical protein
MRGPSAAWLSWGSCALALLLIALAITLGTLDESVSAARESGSEGISSLVSSVVFVLVFATVGALVSSRRPGNPIGWIMCIAGLAYAVGGVSVTYVESFEPGRVEPGSFGPTLAAWVSTWVWMVGIGPATTFLLLLFPSGHLPSRRWRPVAWAAGGGLALMLVGLALTPATYDPLSIDNPLGVPGAEAVAAVGILALLGAAIASVASLVFRYRAARRVERHQLKWLTYAAALVGLALASLALIEIAVGTSDEVGNTLLTAPVAAVPVAMGIAILRHGLYDIDVVINRTLVCGALTATLLASYLGLVLLLQLAVSPLTEESDVAIAGSTLAVAALFRPLRARIQQLVDRRFYRRRYDAAHTLEAFGARLRHEVELEALGADLRGVVAETMQSAHLSLWLPSGSP